MSVSQKVARWFTNSNPESPASKLRAKRIAPLLNIIESFHKKNGYVSIIDLGGTADYWGIVPSQYLIDHNVNITIVNLPGSAMPKDYGQFRFVGADACNLPQIDDKSFDIAHSNSVVEHVGDWGRMVSFAAEMKRVAACYYVQTPNYWFPIEPHCMTPFFHWLPKPIRLWMVTHYSLGYWKKAASTDEAVRIVESARLLNKKMFQALFVEAAVLTERFFWLPKSFIAIRNENDPPSL